MPGILYNGVHHLVEGLVVVSPGEASWAWMSPRDYTRRHTPWPRQITLHTTKGIKAPVVGVRPGKGPGGRNKTTFDSWSHSSEAGGACFVIDNDGVVGQGVDAFVYATYHATTVNDHSFGIEMYQEPDGSMYEAVFQSAVKLVLALCKIAGIPFQRDNRPYHENGIIKRMLHGGASCVGVFGHRDNAWQFPEWMTPTQRKVYPNGTSSRGRGDPGDIIGGYLDRAGCMGFKYDNNEDLNWWKPVQRSLGVDDDGQCGPGTVRALKAKGLWNDGIFLEKPIIEV